MTVCLLLDVRVLDMDGLELQRRLAADGHRIPVIFISGRASADEERRAGAVGDFLRPVARRSCGNGFGRCSPNGDSIVATIPEMVSEIRAGDWASRRNAKGAQDGHDHDEGRNAAVLQRLGNRTTGRVQSRLALERGCVRGSVFFLTSHGFRCIAHDRRGHGRSSQPWSGNDLDTYADDLPALVEALDLKDAIHVGHSTGGGEVARYIGRHGTRRVAKVVLISAIPSSVTRRH